MTEQSEQAIVVQLLQLARIPFSASMNGQRRSGYEQHQARQLGIQAGDPDLMLWPSPPALPAKKGMAVEMKRRDLAPKRDKGNARGVSDAQSERHAMLRAHGWLVVVAYGADDAISKIRAAGYRL